MTPAYSGPSELRFEPPDVVFCKTIGDVTEDEMIDLLTEMKRLAKDSPHFFLLNDLSQIGTISPQARKLAADRVSDLHLRGIAVYGASFSQRVVAMFIAQVLNLVGKSADRPIKIAESEAEARAWIEKRRAELRRR